MPFYGSRFRRSYGRKSRVTRRPRVGRRVMINRYQRPVKVQPVSYSVPATGVPASMNVQMKTFDNLAVAPAATHVEYALKLNSTFDPTGDAGATQPVGRDQIAALYGSYLVQSGNVKVTFSNTTAAPVYIVMYTASGPAVASGIGNYCAQPGAKYKIASKSGDGITTVSLSRTFRMSQIVGPLDRSSHGALSGADPSTLGYLYISVYSTSGNVTGTLGIEIVQNTSWFDKVSNVHA